MEKMAKMKVDYVSENPYTQVPKIVPDEVRMDETTEKRLQRSSENGNAEKAHAETREHMLLNPWQRKGQKREFPRSEEARAASPS